MKFGKKYISEVICIAQFKNIDVKIRHKIGDAEEAFKGMFPEQSQQTNVPDHFDPNQPRLIFHAGKKQLFISQASCQLKLSFDHDDKDINSQFSIIKKNLALFQNELTKFKSINEWNECAIVMNISIPSNEEKESILRHVYDNFFKTNKEDEFGSLASISFKAGYKTKEKLYLNYEIDVYELQKIEFSGPIPANQNILLDAKNLTMVERGIGVRLDINNRPKTESESYVYSGIDEFIPIVSEFFNKKIDKLLGVNNI